MAEILVLTGTHPDEKRALQVGDSLRENPIPHVETEEVNKVGIILGERIITMNMMDAYSTANIHSRIYEEKRAAEIVDLCQNYEIAMDTHNVREFGASWAYIDTRQGVSPRVLRFLGVLGIKAIILTNGLGLHAHMPDSFMLEMGHELEIAPVLAALRLLASDSLPLASHGAKDFQWFDSAGSLHISQLDSREPMQLAGCKPFGELPELSRKMGKTILTASWSLTLNERGYCGELATPTSVPDMSHWPKSEAAVSLAVS